MYLHYRNFTIAMKTKNLSLIFIIAAAVGWGCIGLATRPLGNAGLSSLQITIVRLIFTTLIMSLYLVVRNRKLFIIKLKDLPLFVLAGINFFCLLFFYISAIKENNSSSVAAMLLYTSPIWLTILSRIIFKEKITWVRIVALLGTMCGCCLLMLTQPLSVSLLGVVFGLLSGVSQALYSVFGKKLTSRNAAETNTFYTFLFATLCSLIFISPIEIGTFVKDNLSLSITAFSFLVVLMTVVPYTLYIAGLKNISVGVAGIICILEPIVASVLGFIVFSDPVNIWSILGIVIVIASLVFIELEEKILRKFEGVKNNERL